MTRRAILILAMSFGVAVLAMLALALGPVPITPSAILGVLTGGGDAAHRVIVLDIRLPRLLASLSVGAALGLTGAAMQGLLRNPLADPGVLGISASATLGATTVLYFGLAAGGSWGVPLGALCGAAVGTGLLSLAAVRTRGMATLILIGVALSSLAGALMALILNFAPNPFSLSDLINWSLGSVANRSLTDLARTMPLMAAGGALLWSQRRALSLLTLGEDSATALGLDVARTRWLVVVGTGLTVGGGVALAGAIGFIGIVAPHLVRPWVGQDPGRTLIPAALAGAIMLASADLILRIAPTGTELRLGVVAALIGAPWFCWIAWRRGTVAHG